ncbi:MAG: TerB family tellurite resistance protein [Amaricoccus sp.]
MLQDLIRRLIEPPSPHPLHPDDARLAMAALMVRISRTDGSYSAAERRRIDAMLTERYRLDPAAAARVRAEAETAEAGAQDTVQFTRLIKQAVPYEERTGVVEALWRVAATDGINADERGLMRLVSELLGVSDVDSGLARQRALGEGSGA